MANETSNNTAANETAEPEGNLTAIIDTVEESGLLDAMMDEPLLKNIEMVFKKCKLKKISVIKLFIPYTLRSKQIQ